MLSEELLRPIYDRQFTLINHIRDLFNEQFGEGKVDMQIPTTYSWETFYNDCKQLSNPPTDHAAKTYFLHKDDIAVLVYWPEVKITNETNQSHIIKDLYAKIKLTITGILKYDTGFKLNRTTYTDAEWQSDYMHSHINGIPKTDATEFKTPCLGGGPIRAAIHELRLKYDEDWFEEFLFELNRYVYIESIAGTPWRRMTRISNASRNTTGISLYGATTTRTVRFPTTGITQVVKDFLLHLLTTYQFPYNYTGTKHVLGLAADEFWLAISNEFITWYNEHYQDYGFSLDELIAANVLKGCTVSGNKFFCVQSLDIRVRSGVRVLTFKGEDKYRVITQTRIENVENVQYLIHNHLASNLYSTLTNFVNRYYGN